MSKISVIIPVYNVQDYLCQCLDSVVNQTFENIEIICVNDGSTDNSLEILNRYAEYDKRITIINQKNKGLSKARNIGIKLATGKYIYFLDSDDFIDINAFEKLYTIAELDKLDFISFNYNTICSSDNLKEFYINKKNREREIYYDNIYSGDTMFEKLIVDCSYQSQVWLLFINRIFLLKSNIEFKECILHEDILFTFKVFFSSQKAMQIDNKFYTRRIREDSIMTTKKNFNHYYGYLLSYNALNDFVNDKNYSLQTNKSIIIYFNDILEQMYRIFKQLDDCEKNKINNIPIRDLCLYQNVILPTYKLEANLIEKNNELNKIKGQLKWTRRQLDNYKSKYSKIYNSKSFKILRIITNVKLKLIKFMNKS